MFKTLPEDLLVRLWKSTRIDFCEVRIYESDLPVLLGVPALACGSSLLFAPGFYRPNAPKGRRLILHELMHCVQQWSGKLKGRSGLEADSFNFCAEAVVRPSTSTRKLPFFLPEPLVYQPAIGFEFQTGWKVYKRSTVFHRLKFPEKRDVKVPKETTLYGGRNTLLGWSMETDGDEIEFVIEPPLEESVRGLAQLERVFSSLQSFASKLESYRTSQELTPKSHRELFNPRINQSLVIKPNGDSIKAQPQITLGVRMGRVPDLFEEMSRLRRVSNVGLFERQGLESDYFSGQIGQAAALVANIPPIEGVPASNKLRGLVALICQYLIQGSSGGSRAYVKDLAYAMARTDFASMFKLLPPAESQWFKADPRRWVDYCLRVAEMPDTGQIN